MAPDVPTGRYVPYRPCAENVKAGPRGAGARAGRRGGPVISSGREGMRSVYFAVSPPSTTTIEPVM